MKSLIRSSLILLGLLILAHYLPDEPLDPWNAIGPKKIVTLITAISFIQLLGAWFIEKFGLKKGAVLTGFLGGLVSSTAVVTEVARTSKDQPGQSTAQILTIIAATIAMEIVGVFIIFLGSEDLHYPLLLILLAPVVSAILMILFESRGDRGQELIPLHQKFEIVHVLKLTAFIVVTILVSKASQSYFAAGSAKVLTFVVSMFEMHGSLVANLQLHDAGSFDVQELGEMFAISVLASFVSKLFIVIAMGSRELKVKVLRYTIVSIFFVAAGWFTFRQ